LESFKEDARIDSLKGSAEIERTGLLSCAGCKARQWAANGANEDKRQVLSVRRNLVITASITRITGITMRGTKKVLPSMQGAWAACRPDCLLVIIITVFHFGEKRKRANRSLNVDPKTFVCRAHPWHTLGKLKRLQ
jgi:hypothetical protein